MLMIIISEGPTIARIYCTRKTRDAFCRMWSGLWNTIEKVTGQPVLFKFLHSSGLRAILVDDCKPQIDACSDDLLTRNPLSSGIIDEDPQEIVQYIVKSCSVHFDWCVFF